MGMSFHVSTNDDFDPNDPDQEVFSCSNSYGAAILEEIGIPFDWCGAVPCDEVCTLIDSRGLLAIAHDVAPRVRAILARCKAERDALLHWG